MKIITLFNEKGGVGKTTLSTHLAAGLATRGNRVVLVDGDAQAHSTIGLGLEKQPGFYDLLVRNAAWQDILKVVPPERYIVPDEIGQSNGRLLIVPGNVESRAVADNLGDTFAVMNRLHQLNGTIDYVIIDTSPTPNLLHGAIYMATDIVIYPTTLTAFSFDGLRESLGHLSGFNPLRLARGLQPVYVGGIVPTMFKAKTVEHADNLQKLIDAFGDQVWTPIVSRTLWEEAATFQKPVFRLAPNSVAAKEAWRFIDEAERAFANVGT